MTKSALDQARVLAAHVHGKRDQDFLQAFLQDANLQGQPSAQRFLKSLWTRFQRTAQGQMLQVLQAARPQSPQESRQLRSIQAKLEQGSRLLPNERDTLEALTQPAKAAGMDPSLLEQVSETLKRLSPLARSDRDVQALCGHLQQWLRKQGRR